MTDVEITEYDLDLMALTIVKNHLEDIDSLGNSEQFHDKYAGELSELDDTEVEKLFDRLDAKVEGYAKALRLALAETMQEVEEVARVAGGGTTPLEETAVA